MRLITVSKSTGNPVSLVDNIRVQPFTFTGDHPEKPTRVVHSKAFSAADYVMCSLGKGLPCQPTRRNKIAKINPASLVTEAFRKGLAVRLTLNF